MVRPGGVLEVGQLVGAVIRLHVVCVGVERSGKWLATQCTCNEYHTTSTHN